MRCCAISTSHIHHLFISQPRTVTVPFCSSFINICRQCLFHSISTFRPFPDYSPKKPTIRDSDLVNHISTTIKQRRYEPLISILKPYESKFKMDHLIWVLMEIKSDYKLVLNFFDWVSLRRNPSLEARCVMVHIAVGANDRKMAHKLIQERLIKPSFEVSLSCDHFVEKLLYTYKGWGSNTFVFDIFFRVLVEVGMLNDAMRFSSKLINYGLVLSVDSCNLYIFRLPKTFDGLVKALSFFCEFSGLGIRWNTASYNILIHFLCQLGKIKDAHGLLLKMELWGCIPDVISYSTVINGYCHLGKLQVVLILIEEMQKRGLKPNSFTYTSIISLLCKSSRVRDAELMLREMPGRGIVPDKVVYTTLIDGYFKIGNVSAAYKMINEMQNCKIIPDFVTHTSIICGLCQTGKMVEAEKLFDDMSSREMEPDEVTFTVLIDGYCKSGEMKKAFSYHNRMVSVGLIPNVVTYSALVDGLCKNGEVHTANELLHEMCEKGMIEDGESLLKWMMDKGIEPNATTYNSLMKQHCIRNNVRVVTEMYKEMCGKGVVPDSNTYNILIKGHCKARNMKEAWFLHKAMVEKGYGLTVSSYNALIKGFLKRKKLSEAKEIFEEMRRNELVIDGELYSVFIDMSYSDGELDLTLQLCDEMIEKCLVDRSSIEDT